MQNSEYPEFPNLGSYQTHFRVEKKFFHMSSIENFNHLLPLNNSFQIEYLF